MNEMTEQINAVQYLWHEKKYGSTKNAYVPTAVYRPCLCVFNSLCNNLFLLLVCFISLLFLICSGHFFSHLGTWFLVIPLCLWGLATCIANAHQEFNYCKEQGLPVITERCEHNLDTHNSLVDYGTVSSKGYLNPAA
jgi:hypothetical protein